MKKFNLVGQRFGRLTVVAYAETRGKIGNRRPYWLCKCDCGNEKIVSATQLKCKHTKSCGCLSRETTGDLNRTHNMSRTHIYGIWCSMKERCNNPQCKSFKNYGGRDITVCERWLEFENFYADMGERPEGLSLERIDNNKGYSLDNCKWATRKEQMRNSRRNRMIEYQGQTKCLSEWAQMFGMRFERLRERLNAGWPIEKALMQKIRQGKYNART